VKILLTFVKNQALLSDRAAKYNTSQNIQHLTFMHKQSESWYKTLALDCLLQAAGIYGATLRTATAGCTGFSWKRWLKLAQRLSRGNRFSKTLAEMNWSVRQRAGRWAGCEDHCLWLPRHRGHHARSSGASSQRTSGRETTAKER